MKHHLIYFVLFTLTYILISCSSDKKSTTEEPEGVSTVLPDTKNEVTIITLTPQVFHHELISNGKVSARGTADLRFQSAENIANIYVKNGDHVRKGQKIAELDKFRLSNKLVQSKEAVERGELELQEVLIGQGYTLENMDKVPEDIMQLARLRSSYDQNQAQYELARYELENAVLTAPFDGVVANLFSKIHNVANTSETFCTIIDTRGMEVDFTVLENELPLIKNGDKVVISPYSDISATFNGHISEINPVVDEKGMVKIKAKVDAGNKLFTGMNVRISVQRSLGQQLVIPKSAVVLRSGKQVVFTLKDGRAQWNYIQTSLENAEYYTVVQGVKDTLHEGDVVIVTGNINLAHEAPVSVIND